MYKINIKDDCEKYQKDFAWAVKYKEFLVVDNVKVYFSYQIISKDGARLTLFIPDGMNSKSFRTKCYHELKNKNDVLSVSYVLLKELEKAVFEELKELNSFELS